MRNLPFLAVILILTGCATKPANQPAVNLVTFSKPGSGEIEEIPRSSLVGTWYGSQPTVDGTTKEWITQRLPDGRFQVHFRQKKAGEILHDSIEVGEWGLSYDFEIVVIRGWLIDGQFQPSRNNAFFWDLYQIEHIDQHGMTYVHHGTGHRYQVRRVPDDFEFPKESI